MKNHADIIVGLGFGDEGKGTMVDYLCASTGADLVVRYNGGSQAAHNVVTENGVHHCFQQFGAGSLVPGVKTLLSRLMMVDPIALAEEAAILSPKLGHHALENHYIDARAPIITPFHVTANRVRETIRGENRHGSCGKGIGELGSDLVNHPDQVIRAGDLTNPRLVAEKLHAIQDRQRFEKTSIISAHAPSELSKAYFEMAQHLNIKQSEWCDALIRNSACVFEGAQGVLLDEDFGFHPFTTWSKTTADNAYKLLSEAGFQGSTRTIGVIRSYGTRHGPGPFPAEDAEWQRQHHKEHNDHGEYQGAFRTGWFDFLMLRYALSCLSRKPDCLAITHLDAVRNCGGIPYCDTYTDADGEPIELIRHGKDLIEQEELTRGLMTVKKDHTGIFNTPEELVKFVERQTDIPVRYTSFGPGRQDKTY